jgi:hypothetical protein
MLNMLPPSKAMPLAVQFGRILPVTPQEVMCSGIAAVLTEPTQPAVQTFVHQQSATSCSVRVLRQVILA